MAALAIETRPQHQTTSDPFLALGVQARSKSRLHRNPDLVFSILDYLCCMMLSLHRYHVFFTRTMSILFPFWRAIPKGG